MRTTSLFYLFLLMTFASNMAHADTLTIGEPTKVYSLDKYVHYLEESGADFTIDDVIRAEKNGLFIKNEGGPLAFGVTKNTYWLQVSLVNPYQRSLQFVMKIDDPSLYTVDIFQISSSGPIETGQAGIFFKQKERALAGNDTAFPLVLQAGEHKSIYLRVRSGNFISLPMELIPPLKYYQKSVRSRTIFSVYYGVLITIVIYNLFLFFTTGQKPFLFYILYSIFFGLLSGSFDGFTGQYFNWFVKLTNGYHDVWTSSFANIFGILFALTFLGVDRSYGKYYNGALALIGLNVLIIVLSFIFPTVVFDIMSIAALVNIGILIAIGIKSYKRGNAMALFFIVAFIVLSIFVIIAILFLYKLVPNNFLTFYSFHIGYILNLIILSFGLSQKINQIRQDLVKKEFGIEFEKQQLIAEKNKELEQKVTERTEEITQKETNLRSILDNNDNAICLVNRKMQLIDYNEMMDNFYQNTFGTKIGRLKNILDMTNTQKFRGQLEQHLHQALSGSKSSFSNTYKIGGKARKIEFKVFPIHKNNRVNGMSIFAKDITVRHNAKARLKSQNKELKKVNQELDRFVYSASHDLKAPLASIKGLVNVAQMENDQSRQLDYFEMMDRSINKLDNFIEDIVQFSRNARTQVKTEKIDFAAMIEDVYEGLSYLSDKKIDKTYSIELNSSFVTDKKRLKVILNNLVSNAVRYADPVKDEKYVKIEVMGSKESVKISVIDNGLGIEKQYQGNIFDMFYRANEYVSGSGLGLYIVKESLEKIGGEIEVASVFKVGSTFVVTLPNLAEAE